MFVLIGSKDNAVYLFKQKGPLLVYLYMADINKEIEFFESIKNDLELKYTGKWILIQNQKLIDNYDTFEKAAEDAVRLFGRGPYLIRQVGKLPFVLPASVAFITHRNG